MRGSVPGLRERRFGPQIQKEMSEPVKSAKGNGLGKVQTASETRAATRWHRSKSRRPGTIINNVDGVDKQEHARGVSGFDP